MDRVEVSNAELRTVRDAMRELNQMVDSLERGESEKFVLTQRNRMRAVVVSLEEFAKLQRESRAPLPISPVNESGLVGLERSVRAQ